MSNREKHETDEQPTEAAETVESTESAPSVKGKRLKTRLKTGVRGGWSVGGLSTWSCIDK